MKSDTYTYHEGLLGVTLDNKASCFIQIKRPTLGISMIIAESLRYVSVDVCTSGSVYSQCLQTSLLRLSNRQQSAPPPAPQLEKKKKTQERLATAAVYPPAAYILRILTAA